MIYLDLPETYDGEYALRHCGVNDDQLLVIYPGDLQGALVLTHDLIALAYSGMVVVDAGLLSHDEVKTTPPVGHLLERLRTPLRRSASPSSKRGWS